MDAGRIDIDHADQHDDEKNHEHDDAVDPSGGSTRKVTVQVVQGPFHPQLLQDSWGRQPLLIRQAFDASALVNEQHIWPQFSELMDLAAYDDDDERGGMMCEENFETDVDDFEDDSGDESYFLGEEEYMQSAETVMDSQTGESARLITHIPHQLDSFHMEMGPFHRKELQSLVISPKNDDSLSVEEKWTLLVNDVDRYKPALAQWMDETFAFLPRWRRDDAQISIAPPGGGIGPHVDNYDVFLVQAQGSRSWKIGHQSLTVAQEMDALVDGINVRILQQQQAEDAVDEGASFTEWHVEAGDVLYLPPRVVHWGTASEPVSVDHDSMCMTLSVGCRAPSASDLMARIAEQMATSVAAAATARFQDINLLQNESSTSKPDINILSLTNEVKEQMGALAENALSELIHDTAKWDELVGKTVTEPNRFLVGAIVPYDEIWDDDFLDRWGKTPSNALRKVVKGRGSLRRANGISFATSTLVIERCSVYRLFGFGQMWQVEDAHESSDTVSQRIFGCIERGVPIGRQDLEGATEGLLKVVEDLIAEGLLCATDEKG